MNVNKLKQPTRYEVGQRFSLECCPTAYVYLFNSSISNRKVQNVDLFVEVTICVQLIFQQFIL